MGGTVRAECLDWLLIVGRGHLGRYFGSMLSITTDSVHTGRSGWRRQIRVSGWLLLVRIGKARCIDVTCSAGSYTSTSELHERLYAPHSSGQRTSSTWSGASAQASA
jgi:hypothetical protein